MNYDKASRKLSYLLRHSRSSLYIDLNGGWASVERILQELQLTREELDEIVRTDTKGRYSYNADGTKIRANQGHSIPDVVVEMEQPEPPEFLFHGTATRFLDAILEEGLKPMSRQWVHISADYDTAMMVGKRHGKPIVLLIQGKEFVSDGHSLFRSANGVWQAEAVPPEYLEIVQMEERGKEVWSHEEVKKMLLEDEDYPHGSYLRRGEPKSREAVRTKHLQDFLKEEAPNDPT